MWPVAAAAGAALAVLFGALSLRTRGVYFIMITLSFAQMVSITVSSLQVLGAADGVGLPTRNTLAGFPLDATVAFHYVVLATATALLALVAAVSRSAFGTVLRGIADNERRMRAAGYDTTRLMLVAFVASGGVCGLAGALLANYYLFVGPAYLHWLVSGELLTMVVLGGLGHVLGPALGAFALILAEAGLSELTTSWRLFLGPAVVLLVLKLPGGLLQIGRGAAPSEGPAHA